LCSIFSFFAPGQSVRLVLCGSTRFLSFHFPPSFECSGLSCKTRCFPPSLVVALFDVLLHREFAFPYGPIPSLSLSSCSGRLLIAWFSSALGSFTVVVPTLQPSRFFAHMFLCQPISFPTPTWCVASAFNHHPRSAFETTSDAPCRKGMRISSPLNWSSLHFLPSFSISWSPTRSEEFLPPPFPFNISSSRLDTAFLPLSI